MWIVMLALPFPLEKVGVAISLSVCAIFQIIFSKTLETQRVKHQREKGASKFMKRMPTVTKSCNVFNAPVMPQCDLDLSKLDISNGSPKRNAVHRSSLVRSPGFTKPRPVISPSRFSSSSFEYVSAVFFHNGRL
jgi:hypothetical protein